MGTAARVYAEQLAKFEFGQALWWPEPTRAPNGQPHEPEIGDVGYIDEDGAFQVLFNVSHSADHESHAGPPPIPRCFVPLDYDRNLVETKERFCTTGPLYSSGVRSQRMQSLLSADVPNMPVGGTLSYRFKCNRQQGAFLMLWDDATKTVVQKQERKFEEYMLHHHQSWVDYATDTKYLGLRRKPEDIILVRGTIKTSSWTVGAFFGDGREDHEVALEGRLGPVVNVSFQYALHESSECSPVPPRSGPAHRVSSTDITTNSSHLLTNPAGTSDIAEHTANKKDQCVFLSFYKMKYRRLFPRQIRAAADVFGGGNIGGTEDEDRIYNSVSEDSAGVETEFTGSTARSPLDDILDYILETSTAAMAITSHKDLQALTPVLSDDWPSTFSAFLRQTLPDVVVDHSGVGRVHMEELLISPGAKRESPSLLHSMPAVITNSITSQDYPGPPGTRSSSYGSAYHHALVPEEDITFSNTQGSTRAPPESVMRPNNFNTSLVNRMSQLSHQNQVGIPVQNIMGNATVDQARMWRQMQQIQQIQQHQQHMPLRAQGTGDEFKEMLRSQSIARQPQQHMHQDNQHQLFGLTGRKGGSSQMHDQNPQTMRQPQSRLDALSQAFAQRNIPMNITRQFDMLAQSQSQQQQQGPPPNAASFALLQYQQQQQRAQLQQAALQQQQQQYLRQQGMMAGQGAQGNFSPAAQNMSQLADGGAQRFAGGVLANQPALTQQQQQQQQQNAVFRSPQTRAMALATLRQRYPVVQGQLQDLERQLALVQSPAMLHKSEAERHQESDRLMKEIEQKKEMLQKIHSMTTALVADLQATTKQQPHQKPGRPQTTPALSAATTMEKQREAMTTASPTATSTPFANAPTATNVKSSPTPKVSQPKSRAKPVPKRKALAAKILVPAGSSMDPPPAPTATAPESASTSVSAATPSAMDQSSPAAATPESTGTKRRREGEATSSAVVLVNTPSTKKARTDQDGPMNTELMKKTEEVDALQGKSDEDAVKFFESVRELSNMASNDESANDIGSRVVTPDILQASNAPDTATIVESKMEDGTLGLDSLRLGIWKEIDKGIGSYHQPGDGWKWDVPMPTSDQSWEIASKNEPKIEDGTLDGGTDSYHQPQDGWSVDRHSTTLAGLVKKEQRDDTVWFESEEDEMKFSQDKQKGVERSEEETHDPRRQLSEDARRFFRGLKKIVVGLANPSESELEMQEEEVNALRTQFGADIDSFFSSMKSAARSSRDQNFAELTKREDSPGSVDEDVAMDSARSTPVKDEKVTSDPYGNFVEKREEAGASLQMM